MGRTKSTLLIGLLGLLGVLALGALTGALLFSLQDGGSALPTGGPATSPGGVAREAAAPETPTLEPAVAPQAPAERRDVAADAPRVTGRLVCGERELAGVGIRVLSWRRDAELAHTRTDGSGRFRLVGLEPAPYRLVIDGDGTPHDFEHGFAVGRGQGLDLGDIGVPVPATLSGRIVGEDGQPMARVRVYHGFRQGFSMASFQRALPPDAAGADPSALTADDGTFTFERLVPGRHHVLVEHPGFADLEASREVAGGEHADLGDLQLRHGRSVSGQVRTADGEAVAGALVAPVTIIGFRGPALRRAVRTDARGAFALDALGRGQGLLVRAEGFEEKKQRIDWTHLPVTVTLAATFAIEGRVEGDRRAGAVVSVEVGHDAGVRLSTAAFRVAGETYSVADDGTFAIRDVPAGVYVLTATVPGVGASEQRQVRVGLGGPAPAPVVLRVEPYGGLEVRVVDERGEPVAGAEVVDDRGIRDYAALFAQPADKVTELVRRHKRAGKLPSSTTGEDGKARVPVEKGFALALGAFRDGYLAASATFAAGARPREVELVLHRAGRIRGRVSDASGRDRFALTAAIAPAGRTDHGSSAIDAQGRFESGDLAPGMYDVTVHRFDVTWRDEAERPPRLTPLLGGGRDARSTRRVEVRPGETTEVGLEATELGSIEGTVRHGGVPVAGVAVWAVEPGEAKGLAGAERGELEFRFRPHMRTDERGRYRFLVARPGVYELRWKHDRQLAIAPPRAVHVESYGQRLVCDLALAGATLRGSYDRRGDEKGRLRVYLFRAEDAARDPFYAPHHGLSVADRMATAEVGSDGAFAIDYVPPGRWVLRLAAAGGSAVYQTLLSTVGSERLELGHVHAPDRISVRVSCRVRELVQPEPASPFTRKGYGVWVRAVRDGMRLFEQALSVDVRRPELALDLAPGAYEVELFESVGGLMSSGITGTSTGVKARLVVRADGSVEPAQLDLR